MKKRNYLAILLFGALTGIYSCDYVSNPIEKKPDPPADCATRPFPTTKPFRKVLLEDYTGHKCPNCPAGAVVAHEAEELFRDSLIVIGVHVGTFAKPETSGKFTRNFKTVAGEEYIKKFIFQGYPAGLINRVDYPKNYEKSPGSWKSEIHKILDSPIEADIKMLVDYNLADSMVCTSIQTTFLATPPVGKSYNLCLMLMQDSIIAPQLNVSVEVDDYVHRHVLRDNINGNTGEELIAGSPVVNEPIVKKYRFKLKKDYGYEGKLTPKGDRIPCERKNCYLVAFVYETDTYRILQAEEIKIIK